MNIPAKTPNDNIIAVKVTCSVLPGKNRANQELMSIVSPYPPSMAVKDLNHISSRLEVNLKPEFLFVTCT